MTIESDNQEEAKLDSFRRAIEEEKAQERESCSPQPFTSVGQFNPTQVDITGEEETSGELPDRQGRHKSEVAKWADEKASWHEKYDLNSLSIHVALHRHGFLLADFEPRYKETELKAVLKAMVDEPERIGILESWLSPEGRIRWREATGAPPMETDPVSPPGFPLWMVVVAMVLGVVLGGLAVWLSGS